MEPMVDSPSTQHQLGDLNARVSRLEQDTREQTKILNELRDMMVAARGSWKLIMGVAGISAAIGGLAIKFAAVFIPALPK